MIHVGTDKRQLRSAELLVEGLVKCMEFKEFGEISISDLHEASGVSRATFYRLFDNIQDVLSYKCKMIAAELPEQLKEGGQEEGFLLFSLGYWMKQHKFLEAVYTSGRGDILQEALLEYSSFLKEYLPIESITRVQIDYFLSASMGFLSNILLTWVKRGKKETAGDLLEMFYDLYKVMPGALN